MPHLKQPLLLDQHAFLQAPEIQMRLATCHYDAAVCRVEVHTKHRLVGALKQRKCCRYTCTCRILLIFLFLTHFNFSQSVLSLPVPDRKDVVVGVIHGTQRVSSILKVKSSHIHTCSEQRFLLGCFCAVSLPTWRKPGRPGLGQRSLSPEHGGC